MHEENRRVVFQASLPVWRPTKARKAAKATASEATEAILSLLLLLLQKALPPHFTSLRASRAGALLRLLLMDINDQ